ncbi:MAG: DUF433 domain-containing protein [Anaerolineales bacterium]|nr:DUF433 domain-containing protein [Anaerolineales bacterium]
MNTTMTMPPQTIIPLHTNADGVICVGGTRVTLDTVVDAFVMGATPEEIVAQYPVLRLADVYAVVGYYLSHEAEVLAYLQQREEVAVAVRRENERRFLQGQGAVRQRLLSRRAA